MKKKTIAMVLAMMCIATACGEAEATGGRGRLEDAQEAQEDNTFGGWEFLEVYHDFGKSPVFASIYFEHDNFQYKRLDNWYIRTTAGVKILPWLKADVAYDFLKEPSSYSHRALFNITATLKQGNLKASIRERYIHSWTPPKAAFDAADEMGMTFVVEAGIWIDRWMKDGSPDFLGFGKPYTWFIQE